MAQVLHGGLEQGQRVGLERADLADLARGHPAVDLRVFPANALRLARPGSEHFGARVGRAWTRRHLGELRERHGRYVDVQVNPVQERPPDLDQVVVDLRRRAATDAPRVGSISARAPRNFIGS
jgi:hypothetical protein